MHTDKNLHDLCSSVSICGSISFISWQCRADSFIVPNPLLMSGTVVRIAGEVCDMSESSESEKSEKPLSDAERLAAANAAAAEQLELKLPD
jgi:hypothetical protein